MLPAAAPQQTCSSRNSQEYIAHTLSLYKSEFIFLRDFRFEGDRFITRFEIDSYPLTREGLLPYLTAPLAMLAFSQAGYVFLRAHLDGLAENNFKSPHINSDNFLSQRDSGNILIRKIENMKFKRKLKLPAHFEVWMQSVRVSHGTTHSVAHVDVSFANNAATGRLEIVALASWLQSSIAP